MLDDLRYRFSTACKSLWNLWTLPKEQVDTFMKSYTLFEADKVTNDENKIVDYYRVLNHLCSLGQVEKMYIPPIMKEGKGIWENQNLFELKMMADIGVTSASSVLEVGSGRGRIASHVAEAGKCRVTGINIDASQVANAREHVVKRKIQDRVQFVNQSYNEPFPFPDESFDAVYNVQAFTYAKDFDKLFKEIHRVMKPGAKISILDWFLYKNFDHNNPTHQDMLQRTKKLIGAVRDPTPEEMCSAMERAGFKILINENASIGGVQYPLIDKADKYFNILRVIVNVLTFFWLLPKHFKVLLHRLTLDGQAFVEGDRLGFWTSCHQIVAVKL